MRIDKYFVSHPNVMRVGFCYAGQAVEDLPHGEFDIPLHATVTEDGVVRYRTIGGTMKNLTVSRSAVVGKVRVERRAARNT